MGSVLHLTTASKCRTSQSHFGNVGVISGPEVWDCQGEGNFHF
jgi:hypothetical protein